jgi:hypothetical protein
VAKKNFTDLPGDTTEEKFSSMGIIIGKSYDVLDLRKKGKLFSVEVVLYFEPELAVNSSYEKDLADFADEPVEGRPFVPVDFFLNFGEENDPTFKGRLKEFPLMIKVVDFGAVKSPGGDTYYIKGVMPFLDEFDVDVEPQSGPAF